ncbi:MAG: MerR family transcriptional regulator [Clostridia bacterium]|nr:MerR family transcriptional regulator [Clostridia bacterium]
MDGTYNLNDLALMAGFTTRTLRNYLNQGLLKGEKTNGVWQFTAEDVDRFFGEPFVKEGLRIKRSSVVFDFMADRNKKTDRSCVILDIPASVAKGNAISAFFCDRMNETSDAVFSYGWDRGVCRVILSGAAGSVADIMKAYCAAVFSD